jgi:hypothetical protein
MFTIHNRLDPAYSDLSRQRRKYGTHLIEHALDLAEQIPVRQAARATGIYWKRLERMRLAKRRSAMTIEEALEAIRPNVRRDEEQCRRERGYLLLCIEAAREGAKIAKRTGTSVRGCIKLAAERRGLNGKGICELVRDGRVARHWIL